MRYRKLADTDVTLSEVGFGVWTVAAGWWGDFTDDQAADLLRRALDLGVTYFDTADTYGNGRGETILAEAFKGQRDRVVIGSKFGYDFYSNPDLNRGQRERFGMVLENGSSLRRCVNRALGRVWANGTIKRLQQRWLARAGAPVIR